MKVLRSIPLLAAGTLIFFSPLFAPAQDSSASQADVTSAIESLRADVRADRVTIITATMNFTPQESTAFWPIYKKYAAELTTVDDARVALIREYAQKYDTLTDVDAKDMTTRYLDYQQKRLDVQKKYFKEFSSKLSGQTVAKFYQLDHRLNLVIDLELASRLPALLEKQSSQ